MSQRALGERPVGREGQGASLQKTCIPQEKEGRGKRRKSERQKENPEKTPEACPGVRW